MNGIDGQTTGSNEGVNDNMLQPTSTSENDQPSIVNDEQQPQVQGLTTDKNDDTGADNIEDEIPNEGSEEISGEMQSIQL